MELTTAEFIWDEIPCEYRGGSNFRYVYNIFVNGDLFGSGETSETTYTVSDLSCGQVIFQVAGITDAGMGQPSQVSFEVNLAGNYIGKDHPAVLST